MIDVAFTGLGRIASLLEDDRLREKPASHAGAFAGHPRCRIVGGFDTEQDRREAFARRWNTTAFQRFDDLLSTRPDILVIATHPDSHRYYLERAVAANVPVTVCEKPIADTPRRARRMVALEQKRGARVVVNHERRFSVDYVVVHEAIRRGEFGTLVGVHGRLYFGATARPDRVFLHDGTHMVDAVHFLTDDRVELRRRVGRYRRPGSTVFLHGRLQRRRTPVLFEIGGGRRYLHFEIVLSFSDGEVRIGNGIFDWSRATESPYYERYRSLIDTHRFRPEPSGYFSGMAAEAVRLVEDPSARSRSSLADGYAAMKVIRDAGRSMW